MKFPFTLQRFLIVLLFKFLFISCLTSSNYDDFLEEKKKIRNKIASMQLGNYIRKLMLKVKIIFIYLKYFF
jgi:hypothetical protein